MNPNDGEMVAIIVPKKEIIVAVAEIRKIVQKVGKSPVKSEFLRVKSVESGTKFSTLILDC